MQFAIRYFFKRLLLTIPILMGVATITFFLFHVAGGDPVLGMLGKYASPDEILKLKREYHLDLPLWQQYLEFLEQLATFDFDRSFQTKQTITTMLKDGASASLSLALPAFVMTTLLSLGFALLSAFFKDRWPDKLLVFLSVLGMSVSALAVILFGQYFLAYKWGYFPISGYDHSLSGRWSYLILPWLIWVLVGVGGDIRFYRTVFLEEMNQDYVRTAYAKGCSHSRVMLSHVFPNALLPMITRVVIEIPFLFLGSLLLENFFGIPGLGNMLISAINSSDWPVIKVMTLLGAVLFVLGNFVSDLLYSIADPRVRLS